MSIDARPGGPSGSAVNGLERPPRLPRWTRQEILVLIQGKRVAESRVRRGGRAAHDTAFGPPGPLEPKWASVSSYCKRHGVNRGPVQCRKRWSNLAGDFKKIKEWEAKISEEAESFWVMRNDVRRERRLPGFFDREVYEILDGGGGEEEKSGRDGDEEEVVFDSGRTAGADEGLFSDFEHSGQEVAGGSPDKEEESPDTDMPAAAEPAEPISEKQYQPLEPEHSDPGRTTEKRPSENPEKGSTSQERQKRRRVSVEGDNDEAANIQEQLVEVLDRNSKMLTAQLEAQNANWQLDREQRKDHTESLIGVLSKLADALGRIADKL